MRVVFFRDENGKLRVRGSEGTYGELELAEVFPLDSACPDCKAAKGEACGNGFACYARISGAAEVPFEVQK